MKTKLIGLKEFRVNLSTITKELKGKEIRVIVLNKNKPVFEVYPARGDTFEMEALKKDVKEAREQFKKGEYSTEEETKKILSVKNM